MSTLSVATIKSTTTSPPTFQNSAGTEIGTLCRAWVNFDGTTTTPTIRASGNVSSVTRNGTGDYWVNFSTAMPDTNYVMAGSSSREDATNDGNNLLVLSRLANPMETGRVRVMTRQTASAGTDMPRVTVMVMR